MDALVSELQDLGDLELAMLLSLIAEQHCIITTENDLLQNLATELKLIATRIFDLSCAYIQCSGLTTLDDFREAVLVEAPEKFEDSIEHQTSHLPLPSFSRVPGRQSLYRHESGLSNELDERKIANVIIATDLNFASHNIQTQALELIRTKRLFSHTAMHAASKHFLFISLQSSGSQRLTLHLNDLFAISHHHYPEDGFPNLEETSTELSKFNDAVSISSVLKTSQFKAMETQQCPLLKVADIELLRQATSEVGMTAEVAAYMHNVALFMRLNRYVAGGVSALATQHFRSITRALAPLHDLTYCPPSLVALAVRKVYPHRLVLADVKTERSMQWGSDPHAVKEALKDVTVEDAIEDVLKSVEAPL